MKLPFYIIFLLASTLISCSASRLVPAGYSVSDPAETISVVKDGTAEIYMEHIPDDSKQMVFDLDVWNTGDEFLTITPQSAMIFGSDKPFPDPAEVEVNAYQQAVMVAGNNGKFASSREEVNAFFKKRVRSQQAAQIALLVVGVALAVNDVVQDSKASRKEFWTVQDDRRMAARDVATFTGLLTVDFLGQALESKNMKVYEDLAYLPDEYLKEQILYPEANMRGRVFFKYAPEFTYYRIILPVEGIHYIFDFRKPTGAERRALQRVTH